MSLLYFPAQSSDSSSGGALTFISKSTVSGTPSSIEFTSGIDSTYNTYMFLLEGLVNNSTNYSGVLRLNASTNGGTGYGLNAYSATSANYSISSGQAFSYLSSYDSVNSSDPVNISGIGASGDTGFNTSGRIHLYNPSSTSLTKFMQGNVNYKSSGGVGQFISAARFDQSNDIDAVKFDLSSGSFTAGSISLYGVKTS